MVLYKHGETLYNGVSQLLAEHLEGLARNEIIPAFPAADDGDHSTQTHASDALLKTATKIWEDHTGHVTKLGQILKYMVRLPARLFGINLWRGSPTFRTEST